MAKTKETLFKEFLSTNVPGINLKKVSRCSNGEREAHVRFRKGCGIESFDKLKSILDSLNIEYEPCSKYTGSPLYKENGLNCIWKNYTIGILVAIASKNNIERKRYTPEAFGLAGCKFSDMQTFKIAIKDKISTIENDQSVQDFLLSMLDNIESGGTVSIINHPLLKNNTNKITSDFGEVLAAFKSIVKGNNVTFPKTSNNSIIDYYEDINPISVKGRKAGGKVNLVSFKTRIPQDTPVGNLLYSMASHNIDDLFKYGSQVCNEVKILADWVGGTTVSDVVNYIGTISYVDFYDKVKNEPLFKGLGIPSTKDSRPVDLWNSKDTNPFYFTLNTILNRCTPNTAIEELTNIVSSFLNEATFIHVDIQNLSVTFKETPFEDISKWKLEYHSSSTSAFRNWPAVQSA